MKNLAVFSIFFLASLAIGAAPILIGIALVYAVAWFLSRGSVEKTMHISQHEKCRSKPSDPPPFGGVSRKLRL